MTNVITVYQPYASLIMAGVKTWETRGNPPNGDMRPEGVRGLPGRRINAGDRILIHAARTWAPGWLRWYNSDTEEDLMFDLIGSGVEFSGRGPRWYPNPVSLPLGAILGTVQIDGAIPIRTHLYNPHLPKLYDWCAWVCHETDIDKLTYEIDGCPDYDITDQLPYGNWLPGGWAWELADPIPTTEQCPDGCTRFHGRMPGHVYGSNWDWVPCQTCGGAMTCPPIPVKGKQGVWTP